jgi:hypothetical protein
MRSALAEANVLAPTAALPASTEGYCVLRSAAPGGRLSDPKPTSVRTTPAAKQYSLAHVGLVELDRP